MVVGVLNMFTEDTVEGVVDVSVVVAGIIGVATSLDMAASSRLLLYFGGVVVVVLVDFLSSAVVLPFDAETKLSSLGCAWTMVNKNSNQGRHSRITVCFLSFNRFNIGRR